ncbi:MAG: 4Fe-4S binding protein [Treponema sp.]|nr:4Fe-4S binding protein [Treponema sp.]
MILAIILLILITLLVSLLIMFSYYILLPSIDIKQKKNDDPLIPRKSKIFIIPDYKLHEKNECKAIVMCSCNKVTNLKPTDFNESYSCFMVKNKYGTGIDCKYACIGLGDCVKVCSQNAIIIKNKTAVITNNCCGCGKCMEVCPQKIIKLIPRSTQSMILCNNNSQECLTSCNKKQVEEKVSWDEKKDFKIWLHCYKILHKLFKH